MRHAFRTGIAAGTKVAASRARRSLSMLVLTASAACIAAPVETPKVLLPWRKLTTNSPNIAPYTYTRQDNQVCDFTMFQTKDGVWQIVACIRYTSYPGSGRFFFRWEGDLKSAGLFAEKGIFWTTGTSDKPDALGRTFRVSTPYTNLGQLQAPHCVIENGKYYLWHNNGGAYCLVSDDGKTWTQLKNKAGSYKFFDMCRDLFIFDDRSVSGKWITYYTDCGCTPQCVSSRTATDFLGSWSAQIGGVYDGKTGLPAPPWANLYAESPFVVRRADNYYLFIQLYAFASKDPFKFTGVTPMNVGPTMYWAPEIIKDDTGQEYIVTYHATGLYMAKLQWSGSSAIADVPEVISQPHPHGKRKILTKSENARPAIAREADSRIFDVRGKQEAAEDQ